MENSWRWIVVMLQLLFSILSTLKFTLSGESVIDLATSDRLCRAAIVVRDDGTVDSIQNATVSQIDSATDYVRPTAGASSADEFRYTLDSGDSLDAATTLAASVWGSVTGDLFFEQRWAAGAGIGGNTSTITIEHRRHGIVRSSASYSLQAERIA